MNGTTELYTSLNLHLFDGEGGGAGAAAPNGAAGDAAAPKASARAQRNPLAGVQYGIQQPNAQTDTNAAPGVQGQKSEQGEVTSKDAEARRAEFEKLINGDYRDLYDERVQRIVKDRLKDHADLQKRVNGLEPVIDMLAQKYGVDGRDADALAKAIQDDDSFYEQEAYEQGLSVEQLKHIKKVERENEAFRRMAEDVQRRQAIDQAYARWHQQSEAMQGVYPNFNFDAECSNPVTGERFLRLLGNGVDVRTSYEVIHKDDIMGGAMQYTANVIQQKTVNDIRARGMRPAENGTAGTAAATVKSDVKSLTRQDREEIHNRIMRGEKIAF